MANWGITQGEGAARVMDGYTGKQVANSFVTIQTKGIREFALELQRMAAIAGEPRALERCVTEAAKIIERGYKAKIPTATGNLKRSVKTKAKSYPKDGGVIAITGPTQTGPVASSDAQASGNHAWLYEFGTGPRRPGTQGRRTYINVHQAINGKMTRHSSANDEQFARMGKGYYFLMGSMDERAGAGGRRGYSRDFSDSYGKRKQHPIALKPGETIEPMPALGLMEKTISAQQASVFSILRASLDREITIRGGAA